MYLYLMIINLITITLMYLDKRFAIKKKRRVSEKTFYILGLIGGCFGIFLGMLLFRHKTKKITFLLFPILIIVYIFIIYNI